MAMEIQISIFDMLDQYETPEIPPKEQKKGVKGWVIEWSGLFLRENGYDHDWHGVCTRQIILEQDTRKDKDGRWVQAAHTIKGPFGGWYGQLHRVFSQRPSWADCLRWAAENRCKDDPDEVGYYEVLGDWTGAKYEW